MRHLCLALLLTALPAQAEPGMSGAEFEAYATGKTLIYGFAGAPFGGEEYLENRRVLWSFLDGDCKDGHWYEEAGNICFVYEDTPEPQCWSFHRRGDGVVAQFENNPEYIELYQVEITDQPLLCLGPEVGV
ncbi:hypothetical protein [Aliiroseovarius subalbicans]|uniref:hypothetical protein n=1 Tax=Aliiroseovarius subalbicans TaxID=2925840 RepID=UPI001F562C3F|nr:hypothetical protein [Aliiroseovarius subalbicans]MCI2399334.1 hypothetical protein [Aliiroseovarius subalbicans]